MNNKTKTAVLNIVKEYIDSQIKTNDNQILPIGYNPIEKIRGSLFHWVSVPFHGTDIFCQLRCPNQTQLEQCGDVTNILIDRPKDKEFDYDERIKLRNYQEELCKLVFNVPTFDNIALLVGMKDFVISDKKEELNKIKERYELNKDNMNEIEKNTITTKIKTLELQLGYILPDDTMAFIIQWAHGNNITDIKKLTKENFLKAASLAYIHKKAPSDYISGVFTDFNKAEIDGYAMSIFNEFQKEQEIVNQSKHKWFFGGRGKTENNSIFPHK